MPVPTPSGASVPLASVADYEARLALDHALPGVFASAIARFREGMASGVTEPRLTVRNMVAQIDAILATDGSDDVLYDQAVAIVAKDRKCSTSYIQRKLAIGYNKAARLVEQMEEQGVVSPANHVGKREVLVPEV